MLTRHLWQCSAWCIGKLNKPERAQGNTRLQVYPGHLPKQITLLIWGGDQRFYYLFCLSKYPA